MAEKNDQGGWNWLSVSQVDKEEGEFYCARLVWRVSLGPQIYDLWTDPTKPRSEMRVMRGPRVETGWEDVRLYLRERVDPSALSIIPYDSSPNRRRLE